MGTVTSYDEKSGRYIVKNEQGQVVGSGSNWREAGEQAQKYNLEQNPVTKGQTAYISDEKGAMVIQYEEEQKEQSPVQPVSDFQKSLIGIPDITPGTKTLTPKEAYIAGIISKNELQNVQDKGVVYNVDTGTLKSWSEYRQSHLGLESMSVPETHSMASMVTWKANTDIINQQENAKSMLEMSKSPIVQASFAASLLPTVQPFRTFEYASEMGIAALTKQNLGQTHERMLQSYAYELSREAPQNLHIDITPYMRYETPLPFSYIQSAKSIVEVGAIGLTVIPNPVQPIALTAMTVMYGWGLGMQLGKTILEPTGENLARTFVYSTPLLVGSIASGLQMRLTQRELNIGFKINPKENYVTKPFSNEIMDNVMPTEKLIRLEKTAAMRMEKVDTAIDMKGMDIKPESIMKEITGGRQKLMTMDVSQKTFDGLEQFNKGPFEGLESIMGKKSKMKFDYELEMTYMVKPPEIKQMVLMPVLKLETMQGLRQDLIFRQDLMQGLKQGQLLKQDLMPKQDLILKQDFMQGILQDMTLKQNVMQSLKQEQILGRNVMIRQDLMVEQMKLPPMTDFAFEYARKKKPVMAFMPKLRDFAYIPSMWGILAEVPRLNVKKMLSGLEIRGV